MFHSTVPVLTVPGTVPVAKSPRGPRPIATVRPQAVAHMPPKQPTISLGDIAASILDAPLPAGVPILARRKGPEKRLAEEKAEEKEKAALARAKKALTGTAHQQLKQMPSAINPVLETMLKKTATQGVVALFNAVRTAQKDNDISSVKSKDRKRKRSEGAASEGGSGAMGEQAQAAASKESFLDVLRRGSSGAVRSGGGDKPGATFLRDDFMLGRARAKDFGRGDDEVDGGDIEQDGHGADLDDEEEDEL